MCKFGLFSVGQDGWGEGVELEVSLRLRLRVESEAQPRPSSLFQLCISINIEGVPPLSRLSDSPSCWHVRVTLARDM